MAPPDLASPASVRARSAAIRTVALFEAFKGAVVLVAGSGLLLLIHTDVLGAAARLIEHWHLNPASRYPQIFWKPRPACTTAG